MRSRFLSRSVMLLLLACLCGSSIVAAESEPKATQPVATDEEPETAETPPKEGDKSEESESILMSAEDVAALKKVVVFISQEQKSAKQIIDPSAGAPPYQPYHQYPSTGNLAADIIGPALGAAIGHALANSLLRNAYIKAIDIPPEGQKRAAPNFDMINKSLKDGIFIQSANQTVTAPFQGKTWFDSVEISTLNEKIEKRVLQKALRNRLKRGMLPDAAVVIRNEFVFGLDFYRLWFVTEVELYKIGITSLGAASHELVHREKFVSLYDLRDDFEIVEPENPKNLQEREKYIAGFWTMDGGKLFYESVVQLASENAAMVKRFLLNQPPSSLTRKRDHETIMALYEKKPGVEKPQRIWKLRGQTQQEAEERAAKKWEEDKEEKKQEARLMDSEIMEKMNPMQRKAYMLGKEYDYVRLVEIIEKMADRVIARDQNRDSYYSLPAKNMKFLTENQIDKDEFTPMVLEYQEKAKNAPKRIRIMR